MHIGSTRLFYVCIQFFYHFIDGKQWNDVFLYPGAAKAFPELCHEMWVSVTYNYLGYSKISYNVYEKQLSCLNCS